MAPFPQRDEDPYAPQWAPNSSFLFHPIPLWVLLLEITLIGGLLVYLSKALLPL